MEAEKYMKKIICEKEMLCQPCQHNYLQVFKGYTMALLAYTNNGL